MKIAELLVLTQAAMHDFSYYQVKSYKIVADIYGPPCDKFVNCGRYDGDFDDPKCEVYECINPLCGWPKSAHK